MSSSTILLFTAISSLLHHPLLHLSSHYHEGVQVKLTSIQDIPQPNRASSKSPRWLRPRMSGPNLLVCNILHWLRFTAVDSRANSFATQIRSMRPMSRPSSLSPSRPASPSSLMWKAVKPTPTQSSSSRSSMRLQAPTASVELISSNLGILPSPPPSSAPPPETRSCTDNITSFIGLKSRGCYDAPAHTVLRLGK